MSAYLEVSRGTSMERVPLGDRQFTIGRHPKSDLVLGDQAVSRLHAVVDQMETGWCISDVSSNGTTVNGTQILGRRIALSPGLPSS